MKRAESRRAGIARGTLFLLPLVRGLRLPTIYLCVAVATAFGVAGCTGGQRSEAGELPSIRPATAAATSVNITATPKQPTPGEKLRAIHPAIPVYAGAQFRPDLTLHDEAGIREQFGAPAEVYTLTSTDSFPMVWHYYVTYLGQYRAFAPPKPYPPAQQQWRTMQINLASAMQDPFIPDEERPLERNVLLQITESESGPVTVIRYVITPRALDMPQVVVQ